MPAKRFKISALPCLRLSRIGSLTSPKMASAIPHRLYEQALKAFGVERYVDTFVSVGDPRSPPSLRSRTQRDHRPRNAAHRPINQY